MTCADDKKAEKSLRSNEYRFHSLFETSLDAIIIATPDGKAFAANPAAERLFGMRQDEIVQAGRVGLMVLDENAKMEIEKAKQTGKTMAEFTYKRKDGSTFIGETTVSLFNDVDGIVKTTVIIRDVSERKKVEERIRASEERYRSLFSNIGEAFALHEMLFDKQGVPVDYRFLEVNEAFERQTGLKASEIIGRTVCEILPDLEPFWLETYGKVVVTGEPIRFENYNKSTKRYYEVYAFRPAERRFAVIFSDITERKLAEKELKEYRQHLEQLVEKRTRQIEESERRYHELYESFGEAFIATDWELNVIHWNKAAERVTTVKAQDALGKKVYEVLPEFSLVDVTPYFEALKEQKPARFMMNVPSRETKKPSLFEVSTYPSSQGIIIIVEDKTKEEQTKRLSAIGATAGMVGHDIRNPLQAMISDVYLMRSELAEMPQCATKEGIKESLESLETNILYVNKIVGDLQDYTRPLQLRRAKIEVTDKINNALKNVSIPENIKLHVNAQKGLVVETDPDFLRRALTNLINNAVQAMPNGGDLTIEAKIKNDKAAFTVQDTGIGIPEKVKPHLFAPLFTTKSKGQGLGLAVVKRLVEALNGTVSFESEEGKGTKFTIELPMNQQ